MLIACAFVQANTERDYEWKTFKQGNRFKGNVNSVSGSEDVTHIGRIKYKVPKNPQFKPCAIVKMFKIACMEEHSYALLVEALHEMKNDGCTSVNVSPKDATWDRQLIAAGFKKSSSRRNWFAKIGLMKADNSFTYTFKR